MKECRERVGLLTDPLAALTHHLCFTLKTCVPIVIFPFRETPVVFAATE